MVVLHLFLQALLTFISCCIYPSIQDGEMAGRDSIECIREQRVDPRVFSDLAFDRNGLAFLLPCQSSSDSNEVYYVNRKGTFRPTLWFDNGPDLLEEGLFRLVEHGKFGFMDKQLKTIIAPRWDFAFPFHNGEAFVCNGCQKVKHPGSEYSQIEGGIFSLIDRAGKEIETNLSPDSAMKIRTRMLEESD